MGHHYVPQRYLRGFQSPLKPGSIWMYDKDNDTSKLLPIKQVAQASAYYENDVEQSLNEEVEQPGSNVIDKLRRGEPIDELDRKHLSYYLGTMMRRVPRARARAEKLIPEALADVARETREWIKEAARAGYLDEERLAARLAETDAVEKKFNEQPPQEVTKVIATPWPFESMLILIHSMWWRVLRTQGPSRFLTSDNPAYYFEAWGLGKPQSENTFPLCSELQLHCTWQECQEKGIQIISQHYVKEFNRRIATGAHRFVFYQDEAAWVLIAAKNNVQQLSRIQW